MPIEDPEIETRRTRRKGVSRRNNLRVALLHSECAPTCFAFDLCPFRFSSCFNLPLLPHVFEAVREDVVQRALWRKARIEQADAARGLQRAAAVAGMFDRR